VHVNWTRTATVIFAWLAGAVSATAVGIFALTSIDFGLSPQSSLDTLPNLPTASASRAEETPEPQASSTTVPIGLERPITSPGGSAVARCTSSGAYLVSWSPAPGFKAEDVRRGPAAVARVKFETSGREYYVAIRCVNGVPEATIGH
jgi:hypothetical protein